MDRRRFLSTAGVLAGCIGDAFAFAPARSSAIDTLVIVELDGGNDGLNTVIPFADPRYRQLRPTLAIAPDVALRLDDRTALHPSLHPLMPAWRAGEVAIVQGVGHAGGNRSHFRSRQIWHTASDADEYRDDAWLERAGIVEGSHSFVKAAHAIVMQDVKLVRVVLHGFDTHENQARRHALLLDQLAQGLATLRLALMRAGRWHRTLVMTISEFGRSAAENDARGTDHGAASAQFVLGGSVRGGIHGTPPNLDTLEVTTDFRCLYASAAKACSLAPVLEKRFEALPLVRI